MPQLLQNRMCAAFDVPQREHVIVAGGASRTSPVGGVAIAPGRSAGTQSPSRWPQSWQ